MKRYQVLVLSHTTDEALTRQLNEWSTQGYDLVAATPQCIILSTTSTWWSSWIAWVIGTAVVGGFVVAAAWLARHGY